MITEGLERPLFSSGMVLSDTDLTALVDWIRARFALGRHRHGWGVACGLDVRCRPDRPGWVTVQTGYAVSSTGADLVVHSALDVDLTGWTKDAPPAETPCGDVVVDLFLEAVEKQAGAELVDRCGCGGGCERAGVLPTRVLEGVAVRVKPVPLAIAHDDPASDGVAQWQKEWTACHDIVRDYSNANPDPGGPPAILRWLDEHKALDAPCDWLRDLRAKLTGPADKEIFGQVAVALLELVAVYRHRLLRRECPDTDEPVRLARVWLRRATADHGPVVARVDAYPPYRRELALTPGHPVAGGTYDLTPFSWQRWDQAIGRWHAIAGSTEFTMESPGNVGALLPLLDASSAVAVKWDAPPPVPVVVDVPCLGRRIIGFRAQALMVAPAPAAPPAPAPEPVPAPEAVAVPVPEPVPAPEAVPVPVLQPVPAPGPAPASDPLVEIKGVGQTNVEGLRAAGITTFEQIANASTEVLAKLLRGQRIDRIKAEARERIGRTP